MSKLEEAKSLFEKQDYEPAIVLLNEFLSTQKENADALYLRGICYRRTGNYKASIDDFTTMLIRLSDEPTLLSERGVSFYHNNEITASLKDMDKAVELEPENPYRYSSRAYIKAKVDVNAAIEDYKKAVELDPEDAIALNNLGLLEENAGKMKSAQKRFEKSNEIIGYDPNKRSLKKEIITPQKQDTLGKVMMDVFTNKTVRNEYFKFLKSFFKKK